MNERKSRLYSMILCLILSISSIAMTIVLDNLIGVGNFIYIGPAAVNVSSINGMLMTMTFLFCIIMACFEYKIGARIAYGVIGLYLLMTLRTISFMKNFAALPGVFSGILSLFAIAIIGTLFRNAEKKMITDYTTKLLNTRGFIDILDNAVKDGKKFSLAYLQIDNFRSINDDYGHEKGDEILSVVGERIKKNTEKNTTVARIGGAEFAIIVNEGADEKEVIERILANISQTITINVGDFEKNCYLEAFAGIAKFPADGKDKVSLSKSADTALLHACEKGEKIVTFDKSMSDEISKFKEIERLVKEGIEKKNLYLLYQPQFVIKDKTLRGFEALVRMRTDDGQIISPNEFIPVAEKSNLIFQIDEYVIKMAMSDFTETLRIADKKIILSVNISANGMAREEFVPYVKEQIEKFNFPAECLELEITEYSFAEAQDRTRRNIEELRELGVQIALDDFGTGYTSIAQLINLPINLLKIDKTLVDDIESNDASRDLINAVGYMGHRMDCEVILEGVETESQLDRIKLLDCDFVQGYVWGKPLERSKALDMIDENSDIQVDS